MSASYELGISRVQPLNTGSHNIHFRLDSDMGPFDLRRSNRPSDSGSLLYEARIL